MPVPNTPPEARPDMTTADASPLIEYDCERQGRLVSYSVPVRGVDPLVFVQQAQEHERFYWRDGRTGMTCAGMGVAAHLRAWGDHRVRIIERQAQELFAHAVVFNDTAPLAAPRLFGGFAFRQDFSLDNTWAAFSPAHFILPHYQLTQDGDQSWLTINMLLPLEEDPVANLPQLQVALNARRVLLMAIPPSAGNQTTTAAEVNYPLAYPAWERMIRAAVQQMQTSDLDKVVLARVCEVQMPEPVAVDAALAYLTAHYQDCYSFLFEPRPHHAIFGATPELLVAVQGRVLTTAGLAGSIQRGQTAAEDEALAHELLQSAKDRHEHDLVVQAIRHNLAPLTTALDIPPEPVVFKLNNIQHLYTPVRGGLHENRGVLPLVERLHPTPALGGAPRATALDFIREHEPVPRGWYAAPVGWIDQNLDGRFAVAIRSAVAQNRRVWLYAGAGIVAASDPQKEWIETGWKFRPILEALGVAQQGAS